jgi:hypothetical protein
MGFRGDYLEPPDKMAARRWVTLVRDYIKWNEIEDAKSDDVEKIRAFFNKRWAGIEKAGVKVVPRVYLHWFQDNKKFWPRDMTTGDYTSPQFRRRVTRLAERLGQVWDGDPRVAYVQMGLVGKWGEQHSPDIPPAMQQVLGEAFTRAFSVQLTLRNDGSSPLYENWPLQAALLDPNTRRPIWRGTFAQARSSAWLPGEQWNVWEKEYMIAPREHTLSQTFQLPPNAKKGECFLALALCDPAGNVPAARLAIAPFFRGGWQPLSRVGVGQPPARANLEGVAFDDHNAEPPAYAVPASLSGAAP